MKNIMIKDEIKKLESKLAKQKNNTADAEKLKEVRALFEGSLTVLSYWKTIKKIRKILEM